MALAVVGDGARALRVARADRARRRRAAVAAGVTDAAGPPRLTAACSRRGHRGSWSWSRARRACCRCAAAARRSRRCSAAGWSAAARATRSRSGCSTWSRRWRSPRACRCRRCSCSTARPAINAFAAGHSLDDAAIAVTRGALEKLTRDELQGVIAHEFSHVLNGDMRLNMRLMGVVFGIVCIGLLGPPAAARRRRARGVSLGRKRGGAARPCCCSAAAACMVIGLVGEFFGKLIKAAVSRAARVPGRRFGGAVHAQPERHRGRAQEDRRLHAELADRVASAPRRRATSSSPTSTRARSRSVRAARDASRAGGAHSPRRSELRGAFPDVPDAHRGAGRRRRRPRGPRHGLCRRRRLRGSDLARGAVVARVGEPDAGALDRGQRLLAHVPAELRAAIESPFTAVAVVYALLLSDEPQAPRAAVGADRSAVGRRRCARRPSAGSRDRARAAAPPAPAADRAAFAGAARAERAAARRARAHDAGADRGRRRGLDLRVRARRDACAAGSRRGAPRSERARVRHKSLAAVRGELAAVFVAAGARGRAANRRRPSARSRRRPRALPGRRAHVAAARAIGSLLGLSAALAELRALTPALREAVIDAAAHGVLADQHCGRRRVHAALRGLRRARLPAAALGVRALETKRNHLRGFLLRSSCRRLGYRGRPAGCEKLGFRENCDAT